MTVQAGEFHPANLLILLYYFCGKDYFLLSCMFEDPKSSFFTTMCSGCKLLNMS